MIDSFSQDLLAVNTNSLTLMLQLCKTKTDQHAELDRSIQLTCVCSWPSFLTCPVHVALGFSVQQWTLVDKQLHHSDWLCCSTIRTFSPSRVYLSFSHTVFMNITVVHDGNFTKQYKSQLESSAMHCQIIVYHCYVRLAEGTVPEHILKIRQKNII